MNGLNLLTLVNWVSWINKVNGLTLLGPYTSATTRTSALKNLTFPNYKFGKGKYAFYPIKLSHFAVKKNKVCQKYQNFIRGDPCKLGYTAIGPFCDRVAASSKEDY